MNKSSGGGKLKLKKGKTLKMTENQLKHLRGYVQYSSVHISTLRKGSAVPFVALYADYRLSLNEGDPRVGENAFSRYFITEFEIFYGGYLKKVRRPFNNNRIWFFSVLTQSIRPADGCTIIAA